MRAGLAFRRMTCTCYHVLFLPDRPHSIGVCSFRIRARKGLLLKALCRHSMAARIGFGDMSRVSESWQSSKGSIQGYYTGVRC